MPECYSIRNIQIGMDAKPVEVPELKGDEYMATECVRYLWKV